MDTVSLLDRLIAGASEAHAVARQARRAEPTGAPVAVRDEIAESCAVIAAAYEELAALLRSVEAMRAVELPELIAD